MTTTDSIQYLNRKGYISLGGLHVEVRITDVRQVWGKTQYQVEPLAGANRIWVERIRLEEV